MGLVPFFIDDSKSEIFIRNAASDPQSDMIRRAFWVAFDRIGRRDRGIFEIRKKNFIFVALNNFWWRVVCSKMVLIVSIPFISEETTCFESGKDRFSIRRDGRKSGWRWQRCY